MFAIRFYSRYKSTHKNTATLLKKQIFSAILTNYLIKYTVCSAKPPIYPLKTPLSPILQHSLLLFLHSLLIYFLNCFFYRLLFLFSYRKYYSFFSPK